MDNTDSLVKLAKKIQDSDNVVIFSGGGTSALCGVPTFSGPFAPYHDFLSIFPTLMFGTPFLWYYFTPFMRYFYTNLFQSKALVAKGSDWHALLNRLVSKGKNVYVITQNIDGIDIKSGLDPETVVELHGSIWREKCLSCGEIQFEMTPCVTQKIGAVWCGCGGRLRPDIVLNGESIPVAQSQRMIQFIGKRNTTVIVAGLSGSIGTSTSAILSSQHYQINPAETPFDKTAVENIRTTVEDAAKSLFHLLN